MIHGIFGSRSFVDLNGKIPYPDRVSEIKDFVRMLPKGTVVVSGGARGVDTIAQNAAKAQWHDYKGFHVENFEWKKLGKRAAHIRNQVAALYIHRAQGQSTFFVLVDENFELSAGTKSGIYFARMYNTPTQVFLTRGPEPFEEYIIDLQGKPIKLT